MLTEKGKELATVRIPYERGEFKVADIKGRTIHPDGTIVPLTTKPADLMELKTKDFQINQMVFTLPDVEVGSILEYRLQIRYDDKGSAPTGKFSSHSLSTRRTTTSIRRSLAISPTVTAIISTASCTAKHGS